MTYIQQNKKSFIYLNSPVSINYLDQHGKVFVNTNAVKIDPHNIINSHVTSAFDSITFNPGEYKFDARFKYTAESNTEATNLGYALSYNDIGQNKLTNTNYRGPGNVSLVTPTITTFTDRWGASVNASFSFLIKIENDYVALGWLNSIFPGSPNETIVTIDKYSLEIEKLQNGSL